MKTMNSTSSRANNNLTEGIGPINLFYRKEEFIHTVRSKITNISKGKRRMNFEIEGRSRCYWFIGDTPLCIGDYVEIRYQLVLVNEYKQAWIRDISKLLFSDQV